MNTQTIKVDSKGRVIVPNSFREALGIKTGGNLVMELDKENERLILFPVEKKAKKLEIRIGDAPGSLVKAAKILSQNKVDLIYSESRSIKRKKEAIWTVVADFSKTNTEKLKKALTKEKAVKGFKFSKLG